MEGLKFDFDGIVSAKQGCLQRKTVSMRDFGSCVKPVVWHHETACETSSVASFSNTT